MPDTIITDYFYGDESQQFTYFRIPRLLITSPRFRHLSVDAKLLYGMMLDRMSLSVKNEWYDEDGRVYIYFTVEEICEDMSCGRDRASPPSYMSNASPPARYRPSRKRSPILPRHLKKSSLPTCRRRIFRPQEIGISDVQRSRKPTQVIII